jgi:glycosyltransferase involved in cell wall biosynthesis
MSEVEQTLRGEIAVVVPTRNSARTLQACLESIRTQQVPCTVVVVDNRSSDSTSEIAHRLADVVIQAGPERSAQRNAGVAATAAEVVGFIDSDMVLAPSVVGQAAAAIAMGACSVVVPERTLGEGFWAEVRAYERTFYQGSDAIEAPRFFPRGVFEAAGGFDEAMTGGEDWDLGVRTAEAGPQVRIEATILHDEGRVRYLDACRKKAYYASGLTLFLRKHGARSLAQRSRRPWLRQPRALARPLGLGLLALKTGEITAVSAAVFSNRRDRRAALRKATLSETRQGPSS